MAGTFSQIYIQIVFAVKFRRNLILPEWEDELYKYVTGILSRKNQKLLAINGMPDHIHILISMRPVCSLSELVREIKKSSTEFVNQRKLTPVKFQWQEGYGAFSYSQSALDHVIKYIRNQKEHHRTKNFQQEYMDFIKQFQIDCDERYLFE